MHCLTTSCGCRQPATTRVASGAISASAQAKPRTRWIGVIAAWSPDGRRIAFDYHDAIYVVNADGSGLLRLAHNAYAFHSWSPDGRKLIFARLPGLWVMNADGSGQRNLTRDG